MRKHCTYRLFTFLIVLMGALVLGGCGTTPTENPVVTETQFEESQTEDTEVEEAQAPTEEPTEIPEPAEEEVAVDACVVCHQDKDLLIETAKPVVEVESENEGAG